jgi:hypothetical protein
MNQRSQLILACGAALLFFVVRSARPEPRRCWCTHGADVLAAPDK